MEATEEPKVIRRGRPPKNNDGTIPGNIFMPPGKDLEALLTPEQKEPKSEEAIPTEPNDIKVWASVSRTLNMGNYESLKIDLGVTGIPVGASEEYIEEQLNQAEMTLKTVVDHLAQELGRRIHDDLGR